MKPLPVPKSLCGRKCGGTVSLLLLWVKALEGKPKTPSSPQIMKLLSWEGQVPVQSTYVVPNETQGDPQPSRTLSLKLWGAHCPSPQTLWGPRVPEFLVQTALHLHAGPQGWPRADCWGCRGSELGVCTSRGPFQSRRDPRWEEWRRPKKPLPEGAGAMSPLLGPS